MSLKNVLAVALGILSAIGGLRRHRRPRLQHPGRGDLRLSSCCGSSWSAWSGSSSTRRCAGASRRSPSGRCSTSSASGPVSVRASATLIASGVVNLMTCAAEIGGVAICLQLLSGLPYRLLIPSRSSGWSWSRWVLPFEWIERVFGYLGLCLLVFAVAAIKLHPDWGQVAHGFVPGSSHRRQPVGLPLLRRRPARRCDDAVRGLLLFVGRGRGRLGPEELGLNKVTAMIGYGLGGFLSFSLMIVAGALFLPQGIDPQFLGTPALAAAACLRASGPAARARRDPLRRRWRGDRDVASPARTTRPSSSAGAGARRSGPRGRIALHALRGS